MVFSITEQKDTSDTQSFCVVVKNGELLSHIDNDWEPLSLTMVMSTLHRDVLSTPLLYLGDFSSTPCYLVLLDGNDDAFEGTDFCWHGLRDLISALDVHHFRLASRALQISYWRNDHRFCGRCGSAAVLSTVELSCKCSHCDYLVFPRISPCVIGIVTDGPRILLARGMKHKPDVFSCLAGFVEAGESIEQAFEREVFEEVGVRIRNIRYQNSQPWPFPSQLMLGFFADYAGGDICVDGDEIVEANWYTKATLPLIPSAYSISGTLIRDYFGIAYSQRHAL